MFRLELHLKMSSISKSPLKVFISVEVPLVHLNGTEKLPLTVLLLETTPDQVIGTVGVYEYGSTRGSSGIVTGRVPSNTWLIASPSNPPTTIPLDTTPLVYNLIGFPAAGPFPRGLWAGALSLSGFTIGQPSEESPENK
ncbi:unnamed protein product [Nesidiocoris tenuis]|uniref:Uncharacterized protein n=1 Tax=Nesidiocoris tenuis TaxID=355587 RepID=A0A6H5HSP4_9HEMI|nr:unnamed protein product [Nesidiocoris tenuis]